MKNLDESTDLWARYDRLIELFQPINPWLNYITIDHSPQLWTTVMATIEMTGPDGLHRLEDYVLGSMASSYSYRLKADDPDYLIHPDQFGSEEIERWNKTSGAPVTLSKLMANRIGICASYAFAFAIAAKVSGLCRCLDLDIAVCAKAPHMWCEIKQASYYHLIDLSDRSHGRVPPVIRESDHRLVLNFDQLETVSS